MCVYVFLWMHIYILTYTYTHGQIQSHWFHFFIKNKSFKADMPISSLYSGALHWIAKYLRDLILLEIHTVCRLYIYVCVYIYMWV